MNLWNNPLYRIESRGRGPKGWKDAQGWLVGRGALMVVWRLLPVLAVAGCVAVGAMSLPNAFASAVMQFAMCASVLVVTTLVVLSGSAMATGRDWQDGRMEEWRMTPMETRMLVAGKVWGWALPMGVAVTVGSLGGWVVWWLSGTRGWGVPLFAPLEGVLMVMEVWAGLYLTACVGVWAGHQTRRGWAGLTTAMVVGLPLLIVMVTGIAFSFDRALLGGHLLVIGGAWFVGGFFHGLAERRLRRGR